MSDAECDHQWRRSTPTEADRLRVDSPSISPSYASLGLVFDPFTGGGGMPEIRRDQAWQIVLPRHDGLAANSSATAPVSDVDGRAIRFHFTSEVWAVGTYVNRGDGGYLEASDDTGAVIATAPIASGGFGGIVSDRPIASVRVVNTFTPDIRFGIYGLEYADCRR
jgi:hypothetical protein